MTTSSLPPLPYAAGFETVEYPILELQILALQDASPRRSKILRRAPKPPSHTLKKFLLSYDK